MTRIFAATAIAIAMFATTTDAAPRGGRNPLCAEATKLIRATVTARQKGTDKGTMEKLALTLAPDAQARAKAIIERVYGDAIFEDVPPATAAAYFGATCQ